MLPGTTTLFGFPVYIIFITCSQGLLNYLALLLMFFSSLAPRTIKIFGPPVYILFITGSQGLLNYSVFLFMSFSSLLPRTIKLFGFPVYILLITCCQRLLNYLPFLFIAFWSLAPRDYCIIWLSCVYPFDHLLPGIIKLFGFPVYILLITCYKGLLNYLAFLFMSFSPLAPKDY